MDDVITWLRAQIDEDEQMLRGLDSTALNGIDSTAGDDVRAYVERGLAEVDAKRSIAGLHMPIDGLCPECRYRRPNTPAPAPCPTLRLLALPYADRPGYRAEWRP